jgi:hypothetical protein
MTTFGLLGSLTGEALKRAVWEKGHVIPGYDLAIWRRDDHGHAIRYADHGDRASEYGWEIDHIHPIALGGSDDLSNLRPLHCATNALLGGLLGAATRRVTLGK